MSVSELIRYVAHAGKMALAACTKFNGTQKIEPNFDCVLRQNLAAAKEKWQ